MTAVVWQDKRVVLLSTNSDPQSDGSVTRKTGKGNEEIEIACPQSVINCTKHMGDVDVSDQRRAYCGFGRSLKKWWKFILHFVLNVCHVDLFILYDFANLPPSTAYGSRQLTFRRNLELQLICTFTSHKGTAGREFRLSKLDSLNYSILYKKYRAVQKCALCV